MKGLKRLIVFASIVLGALAVGEQMLRPPSERDWHGRILGIPYDFRRPTLQRLRDSWWNPDSPALFTPRVFGLGWDLNFARLFQLLGCTEPPEQQAETIED